MPRRQRVLALRVSKEKEARKAVRAQENVNGMDIGELMRAMSGPDDSESSVPDLDLPKEETPDVKGSFPAPPIGPSKPGS